MIERYVGRTDGRAFVLFTSYDMLRKTAQLLTPWLATHNIALYAKPTVCRARRWSSGSRPIPGACCSAPTASGRESMCPATPCKTSSSPSCRSACPTSRCSKPGSTPFAPRGGNPFNDYQLPEAIIKLRQGFGRLIRTQRDRGMVVILDPRVRTKLYGQQLLDSLPDCQVVEERVGK